MRLSLGLFSAITIGTAACCAAAPVVFWASDPIRPGETVLLIGDGFGEKQTVEVTRLTDDVSSRPTKEMVPRTGKGQSVEALQVCDTSLKFTI